MSRGRGPHLQSDLTGKDATILMVERSRNSPENVPHYLCKWRVMAPYQGMLMTFSVRADDELGAYVVGLKVLKKRGARVV